MGAREEYARQFRRLRRLLYADNPALMSVEERWAEAQTRARIENLFGTKQLRRS
ncbi:hypothetical protein [Mycobacterium intracellulare]|uniref:Uncharacterized protein n=1 Tax=Mycobacterium intracellulare TaxID=1767 RepID=A0AAE4RAN6_MYCIT|nr:hypothetical protein [Mycobacterium intracellulare]MDV6975270.1 hypothetical protein [Mycobacterium intracellulare]MDV6980334.1 hypothetical protein [Mycobacterium intracellulare]MDV7010763.1 hypothetical protein [Mycobacterium intracellulare]MDV7025669.1 hypothetical protein [Mycobacterium intracellulare]